MEHLGHSSITVTMDRYGHLFLDEKDRLARGLDEVFKGAKLSADVASMWPLDGQKVVSLPRGARNWPLSREVSRGPGRDRTCDQWIMSPPL